MNGDLFTSYMQLENTSKNETAFKMQHYDSMTFHYYFNFLPTEWRAKNEEANWIIW